jgi:hypothetical protein
MPWDHFDVGVKKAGLIREWERAQLEGAAVAAGAAVVAAGAAVVAAGAAAVAAGASQ